MKKIPFGIINQVGFFLEIFDMEKPTFEFWFEFASTYSYLSVCRIEKIAASEDIDVQWKPFLLGPTFNAQGWTTSPFNIYEAKGKYMWRDIERLCEKYNIPFNEPTEFPRNGILAARIALAFESESWVPAFTKKVFNSNFVEDKDISNETLIGSILYSLDLDSQRIIERAKLQENKDRLRAQSSLSVDKGIFGAPTFVIGEEIFWGNDRLEDAVAFFKNTCA